MSLSACLGPSKDSQQAAGFALSTRHARACGLGLDSRGGHPPVSGVLGDGEGEEEGTAVVEFAFGADRAAVG